MNYTLYEMTQTSLEEYTTEQMFGTDAESIPWDSEEAERMFEELRG